MDSPQQTSFIPKKPITGTPVRSGSSALGMFFVLVGVLFFAASLFAAGGAFIYQGYLKTSIANKSKDLQAAEAAFDPATIQDLLRLDSRINNAQTILQKHVTAASIFDFLSQQTLENVQFTSFNLTVQESGQPEINLIGTADSFSTVALQSDQFGASKALKNVVFSNIIVGNAGHINFTVKADPDVSLINYAKNLQTTGTAAPIQQSGTTMQQ